jgi:hypothetical protein
MLKISCKFTSAAALVGVVTLLDLTPSRATEQKSPEEQRLIACYEDYSELAFKRNMSVREYHGLIKNACEAEKKLYRAALILQASKIPNYTDYDEYADGMLAITYMDALTHYKMPPGRNRDEDLLSFDD